LTKSVGAAGGAFDRATKAALDMAAAGFGTAEGNAVQLGKALQDPIKGLAALAKSGVTFTEQEKEKIKTLVESGKELQAQEMILKAIEGQVGGTAEASASSFDKMKFSIAGVSDTFGDMMLPVIDALAPKLAAFSAWAQENPELMKIVVGTFVALTAAVVALNIAMSLNPISLIVIGIGLLIAGLAAAYIKFEGFRKLVDVIFDGIKLGFGLVVTYLKTVAGIYKGIFNGIATGWNNTIGKLSFSIPDIKGLPGRGTKFEAPKIPLLADGGLIMNGAQLAIVGEAGPEAVIPLDRMSEFTGGGGISITVNAGLVSSPDQVGQQIIEAIQKAQRRSGVVFAPA
jgi:phage-related protein